MWYQNAETKWMAAMTHKSLNTLYNMLGIERKCVSTCCTHIVNAQSSIIAFKARCVTITSLALQYIDSFKESLSWASAPSTWLLCTIGACSLLTVGSICFSKEHRNTFVSLNSVCKCTPTLKFPATRRAVLTIGMPFCVSRRAPFTNQKSKFGAKHRARLFCS